MQSLNPRKNYDVSLAVKVMNHGQTPARVTATSLDVVTYKDGLPAVPEYAAATPNLAFLVKDGSFHVFVNESLSGDKLIAVRAHELGLFVVGYVDYIDRFGVRHRAGYARQYSPEADNPLSYGGGRSIFGRKSFEDRNNLPFVLTPDYNYDRERTKKQGDDW